MARWLAWLVLALLLVTGTHARADALPPAPAHHVEDIAGAMSDDARQRLDDRLARFEAQTGHQILVWIAPAIGERTIEDFAAEAFTTWKVGRGGLDDGVAVFVVTGAREVRIEVGYGVEDRLTDLLAAQIVRDAIVPRLREGDFDGGIAGGVAAIADVLAGHEGALPVAGTAVRDPPADAPVDPISWVVMAILGAAFLVLLFTRPHLALVLLSGIFRGGRAGHGGRGGFHGGGGRSGGGGATGRW